MDNLTHTLVGLMLARAGLDRGEKGAAVMIMLAANAPDIDAYGFFTDTATYLQVHRGYTHSLILAPVVALLPLLLVKLATRSRPTILAYVGCLVAVLSHLLLDWTNIYGVRLLLPLSEKWYRLDITDIIDPVILAVLLASLAIPALAGLVTSQISSRKTRGPKRGWAWFALVALTAYETSRWVAHDRAISIIDAHTYQGAPAERVSVFPVRLTLRQWRGLVEGDGFVYEVPVDLTRDFDPAAGHIDYPAISSPMMDAAKATRAFQVFGSFDQLPFWKISPLVDVTRVELIDLRFGSPQRPGFEAFAMVEPDSRVAESRISFGNVR